MVRGARAVGSYRKDMEPNSGSLMIGLDGHIQGRVDLICADDEAAKERAVQLANGDDVELWQGDRPGRGVQSCALEHTSRPPWIAPGIALPCRGVYCRGGQSLDRRSSAFSASVSQSAASRNQASLSAWLRASSASFRHCPASLRYLSISVSLMATGIPLGKGRFNSTYFGGGQGPESVQSPFSAKIS